jgi:hypothetical protein
MNEMEVKKALDFEPDLLTREEAREFHHPDELIVMPNEYYKVLKSLAEAWLGRKMPPKRPDVNGNYSWNECVDACRLASVASEESIMKIIDKIITDHPCYCENSRDIYYEKKAVAHAIAEYVNGGGR